MSTRQRLVDRGTERGLDVIAALARELRTARRSHGLSQRSVAAHAVVSETWVSKFEHGRIANPGLLHVARVLAVVGLDLSARAYPADADAARDVGSARLLARLAARLHADLGWNLEVPLPR